MIDDELSPRSVPLTYEGLVARKRDAERLLGVKLPVSNYEQRLRDSAQ
ncbi:hypothetical protein [Mycobacterium sp. DL440]|nr:hypothetical protein [Mycobacterium sp. DL440]